MQDNIKDYSIFNMEIVDKIDNEYLIKIIGTYEFSYINYNPNIKKIVFKSQKKIDRKLLQNKYQLTKILNNKKFETFYIGFKLKFILRNNSESIDFNDLSKIVVLDRREGNYKTYTIKKLETNIYRIYTDGCYLKKIKSSAFVAITKNLDNKLNLFYEKSDLKSSSLIELMAVIKGIENTEKQNKIRIITDSRYIIKGLTQWIFNWKLNDWHTAQGKKAKNIQYWKKFDKLTKGKYIEFEWVKAHSNHFENSLCDFYAKQAAKLVNSN